MGASLGCGSRGKRPEGGSDVSNETGTRAYHSPLRERQAANTRREILQAAAELIESDGLADFSLREVAARADVSERTLYYHFPNRQAVLDALADWVDEQLRERRLQDDPRNIEDFPARIAAIFAAFDEIGAPARAMARLSAAEGMRSAAYRDRTEAFRERFAEVLDPLPPAEAERCFALLRHVVSATTWMTLREEFGLEAEDAAAAMAWALRALLDDLATRSR